MHIPLGIAFDCLGICPKLLPKPHRNGILKVRAPRHEDIVELERFLIEIPAQFRERSQKLIQTP